MARTTTRETQSNVQNPHPDGSSFGRLLRQYRLAAGLTQEALADRAGLSARGISDLERGARTRPQRDTVDRLIDGLALTGHEATLFKSVATSKSRARSSASETRTSLGRVANGPMVEREGEMARVLAFAAEVANGSGVTALFTGEAGAGKSRMVQEVVEVLNKRHCFVGVGHCYESEQSAPFYPFLEALETLFALSPSDIRRDVHDRWPYLERLLPGRPVPLPLVAGGRGQEAQLLLRAAHGYIQDLSAVSPVAIILEDVHWADDSSVRLLQHLARHTRSLPVLLLCTYRSTGGAGHPQLDQALRDFDREQLTRTVSIPPLSKHGVKQFIAASIGAPSDDLVDWVHGRTEGNPFFVQEVLRALTEQGLLFKEDGHWMRGAFEDVDVPDSIRTVTADHVARLSPEAQEALQHASVLGIRFNFDDARSMLNCSEAELERYLDEAHAAGLVRPMGPDLYTFSHAFIQQAVQASLSPRHVRRLHRLAAQSLLQAGESGRDPHAYELARHFLDGGEPLQALPWLILAGDRAQEVFAQSEAEAMYRQALNLTLMTDDTRQTAEVQAKLGTVLATMARYDDALTMLEPAAETYLALKDLDRVAATLRPMLTVHAFRGTPGQGALRTAHLIQALHDAVPPGVLAPVYVQLATLFHFDSQYEEQLRFGERAVALAEQVDDPGMLAEAEDIYGYALCILGSMDQGLDVLEQALPLAQSSSHPAVLSNIFGHLGITHVLCGRFEDARRELEQAVAAADRLGHPALVAIWVAAQALLALLSGDWPTARERCETAMNTERSLGTNSWSAYPLFIFGWLEFAEGSWDRAEELLEEATAIAAGTSHLQGQRLAAQAFARLDVRRGHPKRAITRLAPLLDRPEIEETDVTLLLPCLASAYLASGDVTTAETVATNAITRARRQHHVLSLVEGLHIYGLVLMKMGCPTEAQTALDEGRLLAHALPYKYEEAGILRALGLLAAGTRPPEARAQLEQALSIFRHLRAAKDCALVEQDLDELQVH